MADEEQPELLPEPAADPVSDDFRFDVVERRKPYLIAESEDGFEVWDERDLRAPVSTWAYEDFDKAEAEFLKLRRDYVRGNQAWFRRAVWCFVGLFIATIVIAVGGTFLGGGGIGIDFINLAYLGSQLLLPAFLGVVVAWIWANRATPTIDLQPRPGSMVVVRRLAATCAVAIVAWGISLVATQALLSTGNAYAGSGSRGPFGVPEEEFTTAFTVFNIVQGLSYVLWIGCLAGLLVIFLSRTLRQEDDLTELPEGIDLAASIE